MMLSRIADYSLIVNPTPSDAWVDQRRAAIAAVLGDGDQTVETRVALVEFAVCGVPESRQPVHTTAAELLVSAIQEQQSSFRSDIDASRLELQLVAGLVVGELIGTTTADNDSLYLGSLVRSATNVAPPADGEHVRRLIRDLRRLADTSLDAAAQRVRCRSALPEIAVAGADVAAIVASVNAEFAKLKRALSWNARADREELEVLWWLQGGRSIRTGERFSDMRDGLRLIAAATELSDRMVMPPLQASQNLLMSLVPDGRLSAEDLVRDTPKEAFQALLPSRKPVSAELSDHPGLLPIMWLAARLIDSELSPGWEHEFKRKAGIDPATAHDSSAWARQIFDERVAYKLAAMLTNDEE